MATKKNDGVKTIACRPATAALLKLLAARLSKRYGHRVAQADVLQTAVNQFARRERIGGRR